MTDLTRAAGAIVTEIEATAAWERELLADLERSRQRREDLRRSIAALLPTLPAPARTPLQVRLNRAAVTIASGLRHNTHVTDKVEALHAYLRTAPDIVTVRQVQRHLAAHGLAPYPDAAAMLMPRKARQGVVERVARGRYRVNRDHPILSG